MEKDQFDFSHRPINDFIAELSGNAPVPGGGGASALVGMIGMALGNMVGSLTAGKQKYADVQEDIVRLNEEAEKICGELSALIDEDAKVFLPLSRAYKMPTSTPEEKAEKTAVMEQALVSCCEVPIRIMEYCGRAIELLKEYAEKGSVLAISDAGVGAICCKAALKGAALNVYINTGSMQDKNQAQKYNARTEALIEHYSVLADEIYYSVSTRLKKE